jgi:signal peptidase I
MNPLGHTALENAGALKCDLAGEVLRSSGRLRLGVVGWSMLPTVWPGDTLVIEKAGCEEVSTGDLVLFGRHRRLFVHRVIGKNGNVTKREILTQGDGMPYPDQTVKPSEILGRVTFIWRYGKRFSPAPSLSFSERMLAALVRRFYWAARIFVELHVVRQQETTAPCQN